MVKAKVPKGKSAAEVAEIHRRHHKIHHQHHGISGAALGIGLILLGLMLETGISWGRALIVLGVLCMVAGVARYYAYK